ncbi:hypothetical protein GCM10020220_073430 [Nonomuraea rubra]
MRGRQSVRGPGPVGERDDRVSAAEAKPLEAAGRAHDGFNGRARTVPWPADGLGASSGTPAGPPSAGRRRQARGEEVPAVRHPHRPRWSSLRIPSSDEGFDCASNPHSVPPKSAMYGISDLTGAQSG